MLNLRTPPDVLGSELEACPIKRHNVVRYVNWCAREARRVREVTTKLATFFQRVPARTAYVQECVDAGKAHVGHRATNSVRALATVVVAALVKLSIDAKVAPNLVLAARPRFWDFDLARDDVVAGKPFKLVVLMSKCPEDDTTAMYSVKENGEPVKHRGTLLPAPNPQLLPPSLPLF